MSIQLVMLSNPSYPLPPPFPFAFNLSSFGGFSSELALHIKWPKYWSFSFTNSPSNEYSGLISFRIDWFYLLAVIAQASKVMLKILQAKLQQYVNQEHQDALQAR